MAFEIGTKVPKVCQENISFSSLCVQSLDLKESVEESFGVMFLASSKQKSF